MGWDGDVDEGERGGAVYTEEVDVFDGHEVMPTKTRAARRTNQVLRALVVRAFMRSTGDMGMPWVAMGEALQGQGGLGKSAMFRAFWLQLEALWADFVEKLPKTKFGLKT